MRERERERLEKPCTRTHARTHVPASMALIMASTSQCAADKRKIPFSKEVSAETAREMEVGREEEEVMKKEKGKRIRKEK